MITVQIPPTYIPERSYILNVILQDFLGIEYILMVSDIKETNIHMEDKCLHINDEFFSSPRDEWLQYSSLPKLPLKIWEIHKYGISPRIANTNVPIIYGTTSNVQDMAIVSTDSVQLNLDIFGSCFFMLTRYEEVVNHVKDEHGRYPAGESIAYKANFLDRPIVNEYVEILWWFMSQLWPGLVRKQRHFRLYLSHDVDNPFEYVPFRINYVSKKLVGDCIKRKSISLAGSRAYNALLSLVGKPHRDEFNTFDWIMDLSESIGVTSAFYFICGHSISDPRYNVIHPRVKELLRRISKRGHEIGIHPSYDTFLNPSKLNSEVLCMKNILRNEQITFSQLGGRQHFLRWKATETWQHWDDTGLLYDSSVGFAETVGFRSGVCYEYPTYDLISGKLLKLRERPLVVMDQSLLSKKYMNLTTNEASKVVDTLIKRCQIFNGEFTLLWHNSQLRTIQEKELYSKIIIKCGK